MVFNPNCPAQDANTEITIDAYKVDAVQANITRKAVMRSFVYKSIVEPRLKSSQTLRAELDNYKRAKSNNVVVDRDRSSQNPSTVYGLAVRQEVIDLSREADRNREEKARAKIVSKEAAEAKRVEMRARREQAWQAVANAPTCASCTVAVLKLAAQRCKVQGVKDMKKADLVTALEPFKSSLLQLPDLDDDEDVIDLGIEAEVEETMWDELLE